MRKRWIFVTVATALALVVLTAGLAYASSRWDGQHGSEPGVTHQVTTRSMQQAQQPTSSCDGTAVRERTHTQQASHDSDCAGLADDHATGTVGRAQAAASTAAAGAPTAGQHACDRDHQQDRDHQRDRDCS
jgi:hypothetical protein